MATPKLTDNQKAINDILKDKGYYTFTASDYVKHDDAIKLLNLYEASKTDFVKKFSFDLYIYKRLGYKKISSSSINIDSELDKLAVTILLGLTNETVEEKIMDEEYSEALSQDEDGHYSFDSRLQSKVNSWVDYCKQIDLCFAQYEEDENQWSKSAKDKSLYKQQWNQLSKKALFKNDSIVAFYNNFLDQNYGLNQKVKAKADYLLTLNLPNVNSLAIAKKIVETSKLLH